MTFQSIEQKIIYEKLAASRSTAAHDSNNNDPFHAQGDESVNGVNVRHLRSLLEKVIGYLGIQEQTRVNTSFRTLSPGSRKITAGFSIFIKRTIRRLTRWYIEPVCQQQTTFNNAVTPAIGRMTEINNGLINGLVTLSQRQDTLQTFQEATREQMARIEDELRKTVAEKIAALEQAASEASQAQKALEEVQHVENRRIIDLQDKMDKLNKLDLAIFEEDYNDPWDKATWVIGTFAQCGEDMIMAFILREFGITFNDISYVDLGANHAKKLSNTYHFYRHGARGVLVEANPSLIPELKFYRHGDVILNRCVSKHSGETVDFFVIGDSLAMGDGLSTPDRDSALAVIKQNPNLKIHSTISVETISVNDIIENYLGKTPTLLNIDIEGNEMEILTSIDFKNTRPLVIIIEMIPYTMPFVVTGKSQDILDFLTMKGYQEYAFTGVNSIFLDKTQLAERGMLP